jgi:hypothetical protein
MGWELPEDILDYVRFTGRKFVPRVILAIVLSLLFASIDNYASLNEVITFILFFCFLIFYYLPPSIDTLYLIKKTNDKKRDEVTLLKLLRASKDSVSGLYTLNGSLVIKSYYGKALKYYEQLKEKHDLEGYEIMRQVKSRQGFQEEYCRLLESVSWEFVEEKYGSEAARFSLSDLDAINL